MNPEERTRIYGDNAQSRVMNFIDTLEKDGYVMDDISKITEITDIIVRGGQEPLRNYQSLKDLESRFINTEELISNFRFGLRDSLDKISKIVKNDPKFIDKENTFDKLIMNIKTKLGVVQSLNRVAEAEASRAATKAELDKLNNDNTLTPAERHKKAKELLFTYNGANIAAINNAKHIAAKQEADFNKGFNDNLIEDINQDLKELYDYTMRLELVSDNKKGLIDDFNNILVARNEFKASLSKHNSNLKLYNKTLASLGIKKSSTIINKKESAPKEDIIEEVKEEITELPAVPAEKITVEPKEETAITEYVHQIDEFVILKNSATNTQNLESGKVYKISDIIIQDGLPHYKLEGMGDMLYNSDNFEHKTLAEVAEIRNAKQKEVNEATKTEEKVEEKSTVEPDLKTEVKEIKPRGKKVIKQKISVGKGSIAARFVANAVIAGTILVPAVGLVGVVPMLINIYTEYNSYADFKRSKNEEPIIGKGISSMKTGLSNLISKLKSRSKSDQATPEEIAELDEVVAIAEDAIKDNQEPENKKEEEKNIEEKSIEEEVAQEVKQDITSTGDPLLDQLLSQAEAEMSSEGLTKEEAVDKALDSLANGTPDQAGPQMGGR